MHREIPQRRPTPQAVRESEPWFRTLAETTSTAIFVYDQHHFLYANRAAEELTGYTTAELASMSPIDLAHPDHAPLVRERVLQRLAGSPIPGPRAEVKVVTKGGEERWIDVSAGSLDVGGRRMVLGTAIDVTERKEAELALKESEERFRRMFEINRATLASIGDGVIRTDATGAVDYLNPVAERLTGWPTAEAVGRPLGRVFRVVDEGTRQPLADPVALCMAKDQMMELPNTALLLRPDGQEFAIRDTAAPIHDPDGRVVGAVLVFKDVTELRGMEREMVYWAHHDPLTGLLNRREFARVLEESLETLRTGRASHALCHLDVDGFKLVNDTLGPLAGDELLRRLADLLASRLREGDTLARIGSDEFGVLMPDTDADTARRLAEDLRQAIEDHRFQWKDKTVQSTAAAGLVLMSDPASDHGEVLKAADAACYVAKEHGRNRLHEYRPDDRAVAERSGEMQWIHRIQDAFDGRRFHLFRQRIEPLGRASGRRPMYEVFIRMRDERGAWITPGAFIPAAEKYHLAPRIDRWVVRHALALLESNGEAAAYTLNLSGQSIGDEGFLDEVVHSLETSGVPPGGLCFEITETAAIRHMARALRFISVLRGMGCRFILDDFGSGLSSFGYLKNLAVDFLKIDREFVSEMLVNRTQHALVKSIHQIGHDMGIETIAEGIETPDVLAAVGELGVDYGQGYWIARPEPFGVLP